MSRYTSSAAVICEGSGRILLVRHAYGARNWELPGGGGKRGESALQTLTREVKEETGLVVVTAKLSGIYYERIHDCHHFTFRCGVQSEQEIRVPSAEIAAYMFSVVGSWPAPISDFTVRRIDDALRAVSEPQVSEIGERHYLPVEIKPA